MPYRPVLSLHGSTRAFDLERSRVPAPQVPVERFDLACGARLLVSARPEAPVTAVQVHLRGGHALDPAGFEGLAYLAGSLLEQGTARHSEEQLALLLEPAGGSLSGDSTGISGSIAGDAHPLLFELLAELLQAPQYPVEKVALQKKRLLDRLLVERDDPRTQGSLLFRRLVYGEHWLGRPFYGTLDSVKRVDRKALRAFHAQHWCGRRALIAVCGPVDPKRVRQQFERLLRGWNAGVDFQQPAPKFPPLVQRQGRFPAERQQVHVYLGHLGVRRADPDFPALVVLDHVLGSGPGFTNRLARVLRDERGLAYSVHASITSTAGLLPGTFTAYIGTSPQHVRTSVRTFLSEMRRIQAERVSREELDLAKSYLVGSHALGFERAARRAAYMITAERHHLPANHLEELPRLYAAVNAADLERVARKHLHPEAACLALAGPVEEAELAPLVNEAARVARRAQVAVGTPARKRARRVPSKQRKTS